MTRVGIGYDVHQLTEDRPLILGGITIPHTKGLKGHSDADVLTHAIIDALLGAIACGNIGTHFPDTDPQYKGANSLALLEKVKTIYTKKGYCIGNIDAVIIAQAPKLNPYIPEIRRSLQTALEIDDDQCSIKATTSEHLGFIGRQEGIAVQAIAGLEKT